MLYTAQSVKTLLINRCPNFSNFS